MRAYLDVESPVGNQRLFLELFPDRAPLACKNFVGLCAASDGYKNTDIHRLVAPEFIVQGGDVGRSIFDDGNFPVESPGWCDLSEGGYLCMASNEEGLNLSQWFITLEGYPHLSASNTVFGRLLEPAALEYLRALGEIPVDENYRPLESVRVVKCGQMRWEEEEEEEQKWQKGQKLEEDRPRHRAKVRDGSERHRSERHGSRSPERHRRSRRRDRSRDRSRDSRGRSSRSKQEGPRHLERDKKGYDSRKKKRQDEEKYFDDSEETERLRRWEDRHYRKPRSRSPSERISSRRMRQDITRHIESANNEPTSRKPHSPPRRLSDSEGYRIVRKGRGTPKYGSATGYSSSGRLGRPGDRI